MDKTVVKEDRIKVFTLRLSESDARSLYRMAELKGIPPSVLVRSWIKDNIRKFEGKLDTSCITR